jgi:hypothetical protein
MRAPGDQRKSGDNQREQAELNVLRCQRRADVFESGGISLDKLEICDGQLPRVQFAEWYS